MSYKPLTKWRCDRCGDLIESAQKAYVTWSTLSAGAGDFTIIHQGKCDDGRKHSSAALEDFLGADGLARLTAMMSYGPLRGGEHKPSIADMDEFTDFIRRVQLPHYEEARPYFGAEDVRSDLSDSNEVRPYRQDILQRIASTGHA